jgi:hypothetical protein
MSRGKRVIGRLGAGTAGVALTLLPLAAMALGAAPGTTPVNSCAGTSADTLSVPLEPQPEVLKGAPYSGVGTTEVVTTAAGGNRVTRTNTMRYFRDSAGRTRTEYQLTAIGPFVATEAQSIVTITDPVAGKRYVLNPAQKRADVFKLDAKGAPPPSAGAILLGGSSFTINGQPPNTRSSFTQASGTGSRLQSPRSRRDRDSGSRIGAPSAFSGGGGPSIALPMSGGSISVPDSGPAPRNFDMLVVDNGTPVPVCRAGARSTEPVSIGERRIEGLKVTGSRLEFTLEPGTMGNDQPVTVRTDQWFSPDLGVVVSSSNHDPMLGDSTYRLEQINRTEPDSALFEIPADYAKQTAP